jgi:hypothetical protein
MTAKTPTRPPDSQIPVDEWYPPVSAPRNLPWKLVAGVGTVAVALAALPLMLMSGSSSSAGPAATVTVTAASAGAPVAPSPAVAPADPCQGLSGDLVTDKDGSQSTPANVVAALEYAYYTKRDPSSVTSLYAPGSLTDSASSDIASFISKIPAGTKYCVAVKSVDPVTVDYDVHEMRPSGDAGGSPDTATYTMRLTVTPTAPYFIAHLHARK